MAVLAVTLAGGWGDRDDARAADEAVVTVRTLPPRGKVKAPAAARRVAPPPRRRLVRARSKPRNRALNTARRPDATSGNAAALNGQGYRLLRQGRYGEAEPLLRRAVELRPGMPTYAYALYNLGWSLLAQGKASEAIEPLSRTARLQPFRWEPQQRLGEAYERLGRSGSAWAAFARAREFRSGRGRRADDRAAAPVRMRLSEAAYTSRRDERFPRRAGSQPEKDEDGERGN